MNRLIIIFFIILLATDLSAQSLWDTSKPDKSIIFGIETGVDYSSLSYEDMSSSRVGAHVGFTADVNIIKSFSINSGIYYIQKGFNSRCGKATMNYLQVPLLASMRFESPTKVQFHVNVGPYFAYGFSGKTFFTPFSITMLYYFDQGSFGGKGFFKDLDIGLSVGGTLQLKMLCVGISYEYGFVDIAEVYGKMHTRNISIKLGYKF